LPGDLQKTRTARAGCPGVAASSHLALVAGQGCWLLQRLQLLIARSQKQLALANVVPCSTRAWLLSGQSDHSTGNGDKKVQEPTYDAVRVAGPDRIQFSAQQFRLQAELLKPSSRPGARPAVSGTGIRSSSVLCPPNSRIKIDQQADFIALDLDRVACAIQEEGRRISRHYSPDTLLF
jgi:hypothetical protein